MRALTFVVDARHMTEDGGLPDNITAARRKAALRMAMYIEYGAEVPPGHGRETLVECRRKPKQKQCPGLMWVVKETDGSIVSLCLICRSTDMVISHWDETEWADGPMPPEPVTMFLGPPPGASDAVNETGASLPEFVAEQAERALSKFCERRVPAQVRNEVQLLYVTRGKNITLFETRPRWNDPKAEWTKKPVARFDYDDAGGVWALKCADRHGRWHAYDRVTPTKQFERLLGEVDKDPTGIFWG